MSFGAAVVVLGALFKLEHLPFASTFLWVGLSLEAAIFAIYGFQELFKKEQPSAMGGGISVSGTDNSDNTKAVNNLTETLKTIFNR